MKVSEIVKLLNGRILSGEDKSDMEVEVACASDLMSDVLTLKSDNVLLITGLNNVSTVRTAEMSDIHCVILARNKRANVEMLELARENSLIIIECPYSVFKTCGILFQAGIKPIF
ncbi:MAG TPA: DRTGG domain-containing protein [Bacteroidales bacterium]|nr:DRTGG domain-containing protein [Bacteroidales bacterium]